MHTAASKNHSVIMPHFFVFQPETARPVAGHGCLIDHRPPAASPQKRTIVGFYHVGIPTREEIAHMHTPAWRDGCKNTCEMPRSKDAPIVRWRLELGEGGAVTWFGLPWHAAQRISTRAGLPWGGGLSQLRLDGVMWSFPCSAARRDRNNAKICEKQQVVTNRPGRLMYLCSQRLPPRQEPSYRLPHQHTCNTRRIERC